VLRPGTNGKKGYLMVFLCLNGEREARTIHTLVAEAFLDPRPPGQVVRHRDGNQRNNAATNLEWGTRGENELDKVRHGTHQMASRTYCPQDHEYTQENTIIVRRADGSFLQRACRQCRNAAIAAWTDRNPGYKDVVNARRRAGRQRPGQWRGSQTHCKNDHEYTPENTRLRYREDGSVSQRVCLACKRESKARCREKAA
jgi:hypothetical protein